jgi:hypothetical protein
VRFSTAQKSSYPSLVSPHSLATVDEQPLLLWRQVLSLNHQMVPSPPVTQHLCPCSYPLSLLRHQLLPSCWINTPNFLGYCTVSSVSVSLSLSLSALSLQGRSCNGAGGRVTSLFSISLPMHLFLPHQAASHPPRLLAGQGGV